jgi:hypothetical protein
MSQTKGLANSGFDTERTRAAPLASTVVERIPDFRCCLTAGGAVRKRMVSNVPKH